MPSALGETRLSIRQLDWNRIKYKISKSNTPPPRISIAYSILFGIAGSFAVSAFQMAGVEGLSPWILPTNVTISALTFLFACALVYLDNLLRDRTGSEVDDLLTDISEIESTFPGGK